MKLNKLFLNPWIIGIGTFVIGNFILWLLNVNTLKWFYVLVLNIYSYINFKIIMPIWLIITFPVFALLIYHYFSLYLKKNKTSDYYSYKEDFIKDIIVRWEYRFLNNQLNIYHLTFHCTKCKCEMSETRADWVARSGFKCPNCNELVSTFINNEEINSIIKQRIETKQYKTNKNC